MIKINACKPFRSEDTLNYCITANIFKAGRKVKVHDEFVVWAPGKVMYRALQCSEPRLHIKRVSDLLFMVCLQIHTFARNIMNLKLFKIHLFCFGINQISHSLCCQCMGVLVNKPIISSH